jgi:hypothetical protein
VVITIIIIIIIIIIIVVVVKAQDREQQISLVNMVNELSGSIKRWEIPE